MTATCPYCGSSRIKKTRLLRGRENVIGAALVLIPFAPAVVYYWDRTRRLFCESCRRRLPPESSVRSSRGA